MNNPLVLETAVKAPLSNYALIRVSGEGAESFLQGQLTCNVKLLNEKNDSILGAHCNNKGRIRALYRIFKHDSAFYLRCPAQHAEKALSFLQFYGKFSKVTFAILPAKGFGIILPKNGHLPSDQHYNVLQVKGTDEWDRFEIYSNNPAPAQTLTPDPLTEWLSTLPTISKDQWQLSEILAGIPEIWPETCEQFLPHYIGLPALGAVHFDKGCYIGQEIIARMQYRSKQQKYELRQVVLPLDNIVPPALIHGDSLGPGDSLADGSVIVSIAPPIARPEEAEGRLEGLYALILKKSLRDGNFVASSG